MYLTGTCCSYLGQVRWANTYTDITVTSSSIDLYWSRHIAAVLCWFKDLFSVDTCQVSSVPYFHLLRREAVLCENRGTLLFLNRIKLEKGVKEKKKDKLSNPYAAFLVFFPKSNTKLHWAGTVIISTDWSNDVSPALKLLTAKSWPAPHRYQSH